MTDTDYDDPGVEALWFAERREEVISFLISERMEHSQVPNMPTWFVAPYVAMWWVESLASPSRAGWWLICGDLPTDCISAESRGEPRDAMDRISKRWFEVADYMLRGEAHPNAVLGGPESWPELGPLLRARASILEGWVNDPEVWDGDA
jgi:hypothetical protein